ncbi:MAG: DUF4397 domain-containing protein [Arcicella sp.]|nr:DUF4397 domain-containing protein [Arcicella sp.]
MYKSFAIVSVGMLMFACGNEANILQNISPATGAKVRFVHAAVDVTNVEISVNDKKFAGVITIPPAPSGTIAYGAGYPVLSSSNSEYALTPAGSTKVDVTVAATATVPAAPLFSGTVNVEDEKFYSIFAVGQAPAVTPLVINDVLPAPSGNNFFIRLINVSPNATTAELLLAGNSIIKDVPFRAGGETFISIPLADYTSGTRFTPYSIRISDGKGGTSTFTSTTNITNIFPGRVLTVFVRGLVKGTGTKAVGAGWYYNR